MKKWTFLILSGFVFLPQWSFSQNWKICNWKNDKQGAVVLTFDDWSPGHYPVVVPELNARHLNATFFLTLNSVASWNHDWPTVNTTASAGHEMGNHTATHPDLTTKTAAQLSTEIRTAKNTINANVTSQKVVSFAYPLGAGAGNTAKDLEVRDTIKASGHIASRSVNPPSGVYYTYNFAATEEEYHKIRTITMSGATSTNAFAAETQQVIAKKGLMVYMYHSVDDATNSHNDNWFSKVLTDSLIKQLDTLASLQNKIWVATFGQAIRYHKEKNSATLTEVQAPNGTQWIVNLTDTLSNNTIYNQPLTLKLKRNGVAYDQVTQNANTLLYSIEGDTIIFDAVPDGGQISLQVTGAPVNEVPTLNNLSNLSINQQDGLQTVSLSGITAGASESQTLSVSAVTYNTTLIKNLTVNYTSPATTGSLTFTPNPASSGNATIVVRVTDNGSPAKYIEKSFQVAVSVVSTGTKKELPLSDKGLSISPNPTADIVTIRSEEPITSTEISIEDLSGVKVYEGFFASAENIQLNLSGKKSGIYVLRIKSDQGWLVRKLVVL